MTTDLSANADRFAGFADCYDAYRPKPPQAIVGLLTQLAKVQRPKLVVDLGCGTGLSTLVWADAAEKVIGIDPSADMLGQAKANAEARGADNVSFRQAFSHGTGLEDGCADIVTCSQSLHWMEPESTFAEVARILRPGGAFAAYDCDWPPLISVDADRAYMEHWEKARALDEHREVEESAKRWHKSGHLERMKESGRFGYVREVVLHNVEEVSAERLVGLALSFGAIQGLLKLGVTEEQIGIDKLRVDARRVFGDGCVPWYIGYRVRVGIVD